MVRSIASDESLFLTGTDMNMRGFLATDSFLRELSVGDAWGGLDAAEYGVLYALTKEPSGVRITDLGKDILLSQTGLTRLAARLVRKGLVERVPDPADRRATLLVLTEIGGTAQRRIGAAHVREITVAMTTRLNEAELRALRDICTKLSGQRTA